MATITTRDGARLTYLDEGTGSPVVLVGGYGMALGAWGEQAVALQASGNRVVRYDRRGHGTSDVSAHGQRMARHGKDVAEVLDALELDDVVLVGASMGASVIWSYVDLFGTDRLRGIVSIDQTPKMINEGDWSLGFYDLTWDTVNAFVTGFPGGHQPFHQIPPPEILQLLMAERTNFDFDIMRPLLRDHTEADWRDVLPLVDVPVLVITGRHSPLWPCESSLYIADTVPNGKAVICEESGHVPFLEQPEVVNDALVQFCR